MNTEDKTSYAYLIRQWLFATRKSENAKVILERARMIRLLIALGGKLPPSFDDSVKITQDQSDAVTAEIDGGITGLRMPEL